MMKLTRWDLMFRFPPPSGFPSPILLILRTDHLTTISLLITFGKLIALLIKTAAIFRLFSLCIDDSYSRGRLTVIYVSLAIDDIDFARILSLYFLMCIYLYMYTQGRFCIPRGPGLMQGCGAPRALKLHISEPSLLILFCEIQF